MVVIGALVINTIYDGCSVSFGIFFVNLLDCFGDSRRNTAWVGSLFFSIPLLCGPLASIITNKIGSRKATVIGGFIASTGIACSMFENSIEMLCLTFGVIAGLGMSLPYFNRVVVIPKYFERRKGLASGIAESGSGLGTIIFAPLVSLLISVYHWRGGLLILGGIVANFIVCGVLFRSVPAVLNLTKKSKLNHAYCKREAGNQRTPSMDNCKKNKDTLAQIYSISNEIEFPRPYVNCEDFDVLKIYNYVSKEYSAELKANACPLTNCGHFGKSTQEPKNQLFFPTGPNSSRKQNIKLKIIGLLNLLTIQFVLFFLFKLYFIFLVWCTISVSGSEVYRGRSIRV